MGDTQGLKSYTVVMSPSVVFEFYQEENFKDTELGKLPVDWKVVKLGEVAEITAGGSAPQGDEYFGGNNI